MRWPRKKEHVPVRSEPTQAEQAEQAKVEFEQAKAEAAKTGGIVCGTVLANGRPQYFVVPAGTPDGSIEAQAFRLREGRALTEGERILQSMVPAAEKVRARLQEA
jgi:hypothetical protein